MKTLKLLSRWAKIHELQFALTLMCLNSLAVILNIAVGIYTYSNHQSGLSSLLVALFNIIAMLCVYYWWISTIEREKSKR